MKIDFTVPFRRVLASRTISAEPTPIPQGRAPRIARLMALAHKLDAMVRSGEIRDYAQLARLGHISPARLTQIMALLHLAPAIQEYVLFLSAADARFITELGLRKRSRVSRAGIGSVNFSSSFFGNDLHVRPDRGISVMTRRLPPKRKPTK